MAFRDFTYPDVRDQFGLTARDAELFPAVPSAAVRPDFVEFIRYGMTLATANSTEKAKSEFVIAPVLVELRRMTGGQFMLFSGVEWTFDRDRGLNGYCDFLLTHGASQYALDTPFATVVEAKNELIPPGLGQCVAAVYAAGQANLKAGTPRRVYGVVSSGSVWKFLALDGSALTIDTADYPVADLPRLMGVLDFLTRRPVAAAA